MAPVCCLSLCLSVLQGGGEGTLMVRNRRSAHTRSPCRYSVEVKLPDSLHKWVSSSHAHSAAKDVCDRVAETSALFEQNAGDENDMPVSSIVFTSEALDNILVAYALMNAHVGRARTMMRELEEVERTKELHQEVEDELSRGLRAEFTVDASMLGRVIGSKGSNIERVKKAFGDRIRSIRVDKSSQTVRIIGADKAAVSEARGMLDMASKEFRVSAKVRAAVHAPSAWGRPSVVLLSPPVHRRAPCTRKQALSSLLRSLPRSARALVGVSSGLKDGLIYSAGVLRLCEAVRKCWDSAGPR